MEKIKKFISSGGASLFVVLFLLNGFGLIHIGVFYVLLPNIISFILFLIAEIYIRLRIGREKFAKQSKIERKNLRNAMLRISLNIFPVIILLVAKLLHLANCSWPYTFLPFIWIAGMWAFVGIGVISACLGVIICMGLVEHAKILCFILASMFLLFLCLKLTSFIAWNWFLVCLPLLVLFIGTGVIKYIEEKL